MSKWNTYQILGLSTLFLLVSAIGIGQGTSVSVNPYSQSILIGEQIRVDINLTTSKSENIIWPTFTDTLTSNIEVIEWNKTDTLFGDSITKENIEGYKKQLVITSFDSGYWAFPELTVWIDSVPYTSEAFLIEVTTIEADTSNTFKGIVQPIEIPMTFLEYLKKYYIYGVYAYAVLILLAIIAYFVGKDAKLKLRKKDKPKIPAHILALQRLEQLESEKLWQTGAYKAFHIQISDITREYIENRFHVPVKESTTDEIKHLLKQIRMDKDLRLEIITSLRISDLAKFAKAIPLPEENEESLSTAYNLVESTKISEVQKTEPDDE